LYSVHLNGELIRHPDGRANYAVTLQNRERLCICRFGIREPDCETFNNWQLERPHERLNCRCPLAEEYKIVQEPHTTPYRDHFICKRAEKRYIDTIKPKQYCISSEVYRKLAAAAHYLIKTSLNKTLFLTLTFPKFKHYEITEEQANKCFSKFMENIRKSKKYRAEGYIAVRERGGKNDRLHYHLVVSIKFVSFIDLNRAWCRAISDYCEFSKNAIQSDGSNRVLKSPSRAIRYICKYISKSKNLKSWTRLYFVSNNLLSSEQVNEETGEVRRISNIKRDLPRKGVDIVSLLRQYKGLEIKTFEYVTTFKVTDPREFNKFCFLYLYPLFDAEDKMINLTVNPDTNS
jgi:hypothetical protein